MHIVIAIVIIAGVIMHAIEVSNAKKQKRNPRSLFDILFGPFNKE